ncbi:lipopolysaccharide biosynthesis protein [Flammeovirga pacifica]|uniref:Uncharacterized protein n=1 Tax=Flammeovirga pacifica TaxID=915059 RepID=A0A1S1YX15_FLAPC|nr:lipopolysaccharide biosynthesis protein [Flammeovirga pacifica]OHX65561.1 hypothetical protein NH26_03960 [Flammeovirga pacifica]
MSYLNSVKYLLFNRFSTLIITFLSGIYLARLIDVKEFGVIAIINIITAFFSTFKEFGFTTSLIQKKKVTDRLYSTIFWFNYILSFFIILIIIFSANWLSEFYKEPKLVNYLLFSSLSFLISPLSSISIVILSRKLKFDLISKVNILAITISSITSLILAFLGFEGWSIIFQNVILILMNTLIIFIKVRWYPKLIFDLSDLKTVFSFSSYITLDTLFNYFARNIDNILIGKFLGIQPLAYYNRAYTLMLMPVNNISSAVKQALFPAISNIQGNNEEIKKVYLNTIFYISLFSFPAMFGLFAISEEIILILYGTKWIASATVLKYLCLIGAIQSILTLNGSIYNGKGRADLALKYGVFFKMNIFVFISIGIYLGSIERVALCYLIACSINSIPNIFIMIRLIELNFLDMIRNIYLQFLASFFMLVVIVLIKPFINNGEVFNIVIYITIGILVYLSLILIFSFKVRKQICSSIQ